MEINEHPKPVTRNSRSEPMSERAKATTKATETKNNSPVSKSQKTNVSPSINSPVDQILFLQRTIGNQAVQRLLKVSGRRSAVGGYVQAKLRIGQPNDIYEQEADRVAEQVMRMPQPQVPGGAVDSGAPQLATVPPIVHDVLHSPGQPLDPATRVFMEPRFGHDFSQVRVHMDARAAESARAVKAAAYMVGRDIVFGARQYLPNTFEGRGLLAHELAHVLQQGERPKAVISQPDGVHEHEVDAIAEAVMLGQEVSRISLPGSEVQIQRQGFGEVRVAEAREEEEARRRRAQIAGRLLVVERQTEQMWPLFESDENLRSQHDFLREHITYVTGLLQQARQGSLTDPTLLHAAEVGLDLAGFAYDLMRADREATARGIAGVVRSGVNRGLAWTWEGMRELKANSLWPTLKPDHIRQVLSSAEFHRDNVLAAAPIANVMRAGVTAASIASAAASMPQAFVAGRVALGRIASWMRGLRIETGVLELSTGGAIPVFRVVSSAGSLALTEAEVIALAEAGKISATALNLYMMSRGRGRGGGGRKQDIRQVDDIAREHRMTPEQRREFGDFLEAEKAAGNRGTLNERGDFTYRELQQKAREFLSQ